MRCTTCLVAALAVSLVSAQETVLGAYIFSRHGDRTAKSTPPANLTELGYEEVFTSGTYFRNRYIASGATNRILGINSDIVKLSQITASAPVDNVLQSSALGFLQGLYPPVGTQLGTNTLRNGTQVQAPLSGYQLIPLQTVETGANSENSAWLQGSTNCANAQISSNNYFTSTEYMSTLNNTQALYNRIYSDVNKTFAQSQTSYKNAYTIWDLLNVASIHNSTATAPLPSDDDFDQLRYLAFQHEFGLAYNNSEPIRAITGSIIAAEVIEGLNTTITSKGKSKLNVQFGAYAGMLSFFGLANLTNVNNDFYGVPDYASTLTWELVTNATVTSTSWPSNDQIYVRFLFHNGTTSNTSQPVEYPLFNSNRSPLPWTDFVNGMNKFAISDQRSWCNACGNSTGVCSEAYLTANGDGSSSSNTANGSPAPSSTSGSGGISKAVAGVIGAMVTLAVILLIEGAIVLLGGFRLVSKKRLTGSQSSGSTVQTSSGKA
ncbi:hypothetical protein H2198_000576 [Neophaeococcomyces mojaviensis]|uniref:Uncharacterized protein n=1 Tax=Neophaeococcomyces mojaviensis TaxID=3383035 RepID=A0ACC3AJJ5_9EURO|nr:hypothetical protein H2198_000576 [Knufia sp. JES_112]